MYYLNEEEISVAFETEPFDSEFWDVVEMASPMDLSRQLQEALNNQDWQEIENICDNLTHQMTFYSATYIVLPHMVNLLERTIKQQDFDHAFYLIFQLGICLATDISGNHMSRIDGPSLDNYHLAVKKLAGLTKRFINLNLHKIKDMDEQQRGMLLAGALAIFGAREAAFELAMTSDLEELGMMCGEDCEFFEEGFDPYDQDNEHGVVKPAQYEAGKWDGQTFDHASCWTLALADLLGAKRELDALRYFYGEFTCPECGKTKKVIDFMNTYHNEA